VVSLRLVIGPMAKSLRVLCANQNRILREGIRVLITMQPDFDLVGSVASADAVVSIFAEELPDVTLVDVDLPADSGLDAISCIRQIDPGAWIIALITDEDEERCSRALTAGASNFLAKDRIGSMLIPLIRAHVPSEGGPKPETFSNVK